MKRTIRRSGRAAPHVEKVMLVPLIDILTILVVFLISSYSMTDYTPSDSLKLPLSTSIKPVDNALKVSISKTEIMVDDKSVVPIQNGKVPPEFRSNLLIEPLFDN